MKFSKNVYQSIFALLFLVVLGSCSKEDNESHNKALTLQEKIDNWLLNNESNSNNLISDIKYDFDHPILREVDGNTIVIFNEVNFDSNNTINYGISFIETEKELKPFLTVKTIEESDSIKKLEYFDSNNDFLFSWTFDLNKKEMIVKADGQVSKRNWGQDTADCINDAYTNHGWTSVGLWIESICIPETGIVVAAACAITNY